jgi:hypothetical protein
MLGINPANIQNKLKPYPFFVFFRTVADSNTGLNTETQSFNLIKKTEGTEASLYFFSSLPLLLLAIYHAEKV